MAIHTKHGRARRQFGVTLVEVLASLAVGAMLTVSMTDLMTNLSQDRDAAYLKRYHQVIADASQRYVEQNWVTLQEQIDSGATTDLRISLDKVRDAGLLPTGWINMNNYGQSACLLVRAETAGSEKRLRTLLVTEGGRSIPLRVLWPAATVQTHGAGILEADGSGVVVRAAGLHAQWQERFAVAGGYAAAVGCSSDPQLNQLKDGHLATWLSLRSPVELAAVQAVVRTGATSSDLTTVTGSVSLPNVAVVAADRVKSVAAGDACTSAEDASFAATASGSILLCSREGDLFKWRQASGLMGGATRFGGDEVIVSSIVKENVSCDVVGELARVADGALAYCGRENTSDPVSSWKWHKVGGKWKYVVTSGSILRGSITILPYQDVSNFSTLFSIPHTARAIQANVFLEPDRNKEEQIWAVLDGQRVAASCCKRSLGVTFLIPNGSYLFYIGTYPEGGTSAASTYSSGYIDDDV